MPNNPDVTLHIYQILEEEYAALHGSIPEKPLRFSMPSGDGRGERVVEATLGWDFHAGHIRDAAGFADYLLHGPAKSGAARREETTTGAGARREDKGQPAEALRARRPEGRRLEALRDYLVWMLGEDFLKLLAAPVEARRAEAEGAEAENTEAVGGQAGGKDDEPALDLEAQLIKRLNEALLTAPDLYAEDRFVASWLRVSTRELLARYETDANAPVEEKDEAEEKKQQADTDVAAEKQQADETLHRLNRLLIEDAFPGYFERIYDVRLAAMFRRLHDAEMSALCLSGGGIRSGTFALGLLQGLARHDLLKQFDYLSTVSGGGYVGSWLTAWLHRHPEGLVGVNRELRNTAPATRIDPDPKPIRNLREYSNFITPKAGLLTADTWSFVGIYLRNLLLNWLVFIPLLAAALMLPRLLLTVTLIQPVREPKTISAAFVDTTLKEGRASIPAARRMWYEPEPIVETFAGERVAGWLYDVPVLG